LMVVNLHATLVRRKSGAIEEMHHLLSHLPDHCGPMILAGDFNTFTSGYLAAIEKILELLGLRRILIDDDPRAPLDNLDQVFVRGLQVNRAAVDTSLRSSDHFPLLLNLSLE